jgi:hypothetical protein
MINRAARHAGKKNAASEATVINSNAPPQKPAGHADSPCIRCGLWGIESGDAAIALTILPGACGRSIVASQLTACVDMRIKKQGRCDRIAAAR